MADAYDRNNIFAKILRGEIPCQKVFEDAHVGIQAARAGGMKVVGVATTHPAAARLAARFLLAETARRGANRLGGPTLGADPLVGAAVSLVPASAGVLGGFMVRSQAKDHGTGRQIEGHLGTGDRSRKVQAPGVEEGTARLKMPPERLVADAPLLGSAVEVVPHDEVARLEAVDAELMGAAGLGMEFEQAHMRMGR